MGGLRAVTVLMLLVMPLGAGVASANHPCKSQGVSAADTYVFVRGCVGDHSGDGDLDHVWLEAYTPASYGTVTYADYRDFDGWYHRDAFVAAYASAPEPIWGAGVVVWDECHDPDLDDACDRETVRAFASTYDATEEAWVVWYPDAGRVDACTKERGQPATCDTLLP